MVKLVNIVTVIAVLLFSSHALARENDDCPKKAIATEFNHGTKTTTDGSLNPQSAMPLCIICLAAGMAFQPLNFRHLHQPNIAQPLERKLTGKSLRPPTPPPRHSA